MQLEREKDSWKEFYSFLTNNVFVPVLTYINITNFITNKYRIWRISTGKSTAAKEGANGQSKPCLFYYGCNVHGPILKRSGTLIFQLCPHFIATDLPNVGAGSVGGLCRNGKGQLSRDRERVFFFLMYYFILFHIKKDY